MVEVQAVLVMVVEVLVVAQVEVLDVRVQHVLFL
jgi:hypothetical protein